MVLERNGLFLAVFLSNALQAQPLDRNKHMLNRPLKVVFLWTVKFKIEDISLIVLYK